MDAVVFPLFLDSRFQAPVGDPDSFNVPYVMAGHFRPLSFLPCGSPCPAGASGGWGTSIISGASKWFWLSITARTGNYGVTYSLYQAALVGEYGQIWNWVWSISRYFS